MADQKGKEMNGLITRADAIASLAAEYNRRWKEEGGSFGGLKLAWAEKAINDTPAADRWIPVTERVPEDDDIVLVSCRTKKGIDTINRAYYEDGFWHGSGSMSNVLAWQRLPDPYEGE